jgi:hypothetical protein
MNHISDGYRSVSLILGLNRDRLIVIATLCIALAAAAYVSHP